MRLTIQRHGEFSIHAEDTSGQCGRIGQTVIRYHVLIRGDYKRANPNGFLLDNNDIPAYFARTYRVVTIFPSCEEIARRAVCDFLALAESGGAHPDYVRVGVTVIEQSEISAEWER